MTQVQADWEQGQRDAVEHEPRLARKYEESLRAHGRQARDRYLDAAGVVTAASRPNVSPTELVQEASFKESITAKTRGARARITNAVASSILRRTPERVKALPGIEVFMATLAAAQAQYAYEAVQDMLASIIMESWENGWSIDETADQILEVSKDWARWQAERLARTDLVALGNETSLRSVEVLDEEDRPRYKVWLTAQDERVRQTHVDADRQAVELDGRFVVGGSSMRYPGDPDAPPGEIMNCRCTLVYSDTPSPTLQHTDFGGNNTEDELAMSAAVGGLPSYVPAPEADTTSRIASLVPLMQRDAEQIAEVLVSEDELFNPSIWNDELSREGASEMYASAIGDYLEDSGKVREEAPTQPIVLSPQITINIPEQAPPNVVVNMPPAPEQIVEVRPEITVNVPQQEAPSVTVNAEAPAVNVFPEVHVSAPDVHLTVPSGRREVEFKRNNRGDIVSAEITEED